LTYNTYCAVCFGSSQPSTYKRTLSIEL